MLNFFAGSSLPMPPRNDNPPGFIEDYSIVLLGNKTSPLLKLPSGVFPPPGTTLDLDTGAYILDTTTGSLGYPTVSQDGRCLLFNGSGTEPAPPAAGNVINVATTLPTLAMPFTLEFYAYTTADNFWAVLNYLTQNGSDSKKIQQGSEAGGARFNFNNSTGFATTISAPNVLATQGKWAHYAHVWTTSEARMYINGINVASRAGVTAPGFFLNKFCIGAKGPTGIYGWRGALFNWKFATREIYTNNFTVSLWDLPHPV